MIRFIDVPIGRGCDITCTRCTPADEPRHADAAEVAAGVRRAVAEWGTGPGPNVVFTGMEPFAHPQLPLLVSTATDLGIRRLRLRTDAGALSQPGNAAGALGAGVRQLEVVVVGPDASVHDRLLDRPGLFDAAATGVQAWRAAARAAGVRESVTALVPLCAHNVALAPAIVAAVCAWGVDAVHVDLSGLRDPSVEVVRAALDTGTVNGVAVFVTGSSAPEWGVYVHAPWTESEVV